ITVNELGRASSRTISSPCTLSTRDPVTGCLREPVQAHSTVSTSTCILFPQLFSANLRPSSSSTTSRASGSRRRVDDRLNDALGSLALNGHDHSMALNI
ncbi:hypothetical protein TPAR_08315, partial [Tolypocladium paradoxum]